MRFQNPTTGDIVEIKHPASGVLLLVPLYFAYKGVWIHAALCLAAMVATWGLSNIVYAFFAPEIFVSYFARRGFTRLGVPDFDPAPVGNYHNNGE
jgi:hypothetical protein